MISHGLENPPMISPLETVMATAEASYLVLSPHEAFPWNPRKDPHVWSMKNPIQEHLKTHQNHIKSSFFIEFCWVLIPIIGMLIPIFYPWNHEIPTGGLFFVDASPDISNRVSFLHTAGGCTAAAAIDVQTWRFYVGGFNPLNGKDYPIYYGKIKNVPNHQSVHIYTYIYIYAKYVCGCKYTLNVSVWGIISDFKYLPSKEVFGSTRCR